MNVPIRLMTVTLWTHFQGWGWGWGGGDDTVEFYVPRQCHGAQEISVCPSAKKDKNREVLEPVRPTSWV